MDTLKEEIRTLAKSEFARLVELKYGHSHDVIGDITVANVLGGERGMKTMLTDTSDLDPHGGIRYRKMTLREVNSALPKSTNDSTVGLPEGAFWLLLTGNIPNKDTIDEFNMELYKRGQLPDDVINTINNLPKDMHPMTQLSIGVLALQPYSAFSKGYYNGDIKKSDYWESILEDAITLVARVPQLAARIYRRTFHNDDQINSDPNLDWAANFSHMLGVSSNDPMFADMMRLYMLLHADHEGGNVSAHTTHLVGSALADPYYSFAAGICGLAGPLHGIANQESLKWLEGCMDEHNINKTIPTVKSVRKYAENTLKNGKVIPGYGHAVLKVADPRYLLEREFCLKYLNDDPMVQLCSIAYEAVPPVLAKTGKVRNPNPNVDAHSGVMLKHYGLVEPDFYTVVFAVSRSMGVMAQLVWARIMQMPIERPKSVTLDHLYESVLHTKLPKTKSQL
ncbi:hypothetical protein FOL47_009236 [Perkinsus chesapeaki]|uniref:Citrate synthase n=1 Tax=Perkinsus chesapeaki TaxID=330153 RepID=A0A7J6MU70_PERCH|nr:hypothetical protein FOL47_009236 [Perkinsus chesapeaki]